MSADTTTPPTDAPGEESGLPKGATVGRYVVLGLRGRGAMGEVYAAYDPDLDRKVALKLLRVRGANDTADGRTRLLREAQAMARLSHPNVVVVFDVGTFEQSVFIAMEFVEGNTLAYWLQAQHRRWREVLDVYLAAGRGLVAAHIAGLVHRDFKPENVMVTRSGEVRVMDFGLVREQTGDEPSLANRLSATLADRAAALAETFDSATDPDATIKLGGDGAEPPSSSSGSYLKLKLTQTGAMLGTPAYMAPEQFAGTGADARTDQFSFCVALYEGLWGRRPFAGRNAVEVMANVTAGTVDEPPANSDVPSRFRRIVLRGMSTDPRNRYFSMVELLSALERCRAGHRRGWLAAVGSAVVLLTGAAAAGRFPATQKAVCAAGPELAAAAWSREGRAAIETGFVRTDAQSGQRAFASMAAIVDRYVSGWLNMYRETCEATHVRHDQSAEVLDLRMECLRERLSSVHALTAVFLEADSAVVDHAMSAATALPALDRCGDVEMLRAVVKPPGDPAANASVAHVREQVSLLNVLRDSGQCQRAVAMADGLVAAAVATKYLPVEGEAQFAVGALGETCIEVAKAIDHLQDAAIAAETSHHDEVYIEAMTMMAALYADRLHDVRRAHEAIGHASAVLARFPNHPVLDAWLSGHQAIVAMAEGRHADARRFEQKALDLRVRLYGQDSNEVLFSLNNLAIDLHELHQDEDAAPLIAHVVDVQTRLFGPKSTRLALAFTNQAEILTGLGRFNEAHSAVGRALAIFAGQNAAPALVGYGLLNLGRLQDAEGSPAAAVKSLEEAVRLVGGADQLVAAQAEFALARALWRASPGQRTRARQLAHSARQTVADQGGPTDLISQIAQWESSHGPV